MKYLLLLLTIVLITQTSYAQNRVNLATLTYNEDVMMLLKGNQKIADTSLNKKLSNQYVTVRRVTLETDNVLTTLPDYRTYAIRFFKYGDFEFSNENLENNYLMGSVCAMVNSLKDNRLAGIIIQLRNAADAHKLDDYIKKLYGKPVVIAAEPKPHQDGMVMGSASYFWRNIRPGLSIVMNNEYTSLNGKQAFETPIYLVKNDVKTSDKSQTVLNRILDISKH
jgi:hypothetical protein